MMRPVLAYDLDGGEEERGRMCENVREKSEGVLNDRVKKEGWRKRDRREIDKRWHVEAGEWRGGVNGLSLHPSPLLPPLHSPASPVRHHRSGCCIILTIGEGWKDGGRGGEGGRETSGELE